jgi:DNA-binding transcriptional MocR family regulator
MFVATYRMGHNPTSGVLSIERRQEIYAICSKYDVIIVEDDPYWYLQYPSADVEEAASRNLPTPAAKPVLLPARSSGYEFLDSLVPSYLSVDTDGRVIRLDTFSKTVAPGCRLGWITAQPEFIERFMRITETSTQQPSGFVQSMVAEVIMGAQPSEATASFRSLPRDQQLLFGGWKTDGWVRWLSGLRGEYERRMNRMCTLLDEGSFQLKQGTPVRAADQDWGVITKTQLYDFDWPRGGMFVWIRIHFERHPLWQVRGKEYPLIDGFVLSTALMALCTHKPYLVLVAPGLMFSATDAVRAERGWAYYRLCFAAETDENVDGGSERFGQAVQRFWKIKSVEEVEELVKELQLLEAAAEESGMPGMMGC